MPTDGAQREVPSSYPENRDDPAWGDGPLDARKATLASIVECTGAKTLRYLYDFGDGWEHTIKIEHLVDPFPGVDYLRQIKASGRCLPEDVGGPWGYAKFLEALADPEHEQHADIRRWIGDDFDPRQVPGDLLAERVERLARKWTRNAVSRKAQAT